MKISAVLFLAIMLLLLTSCCGGENEVKKRRTVKLETYSTATSSSFDKSELSSESSPSDPPELLSGNPPVAPPVAPPAIPPPPSQSSSAPVSPSSSASDASASESSAPAPTAFVSDWNAAVPEGYAAEFDVMLSQLRIQNGLAPLNYYNELTSVAFVRLTEAASSFSHLRPDNRECHTILDDNGIGYLGYGENIARNVDSAYDAYQLWFGSSEDYDNMIRANFTGYAIVSGIVDGVQYWVLLFVA